jgi:multiple sugar transport system substrate-binding protein
MKVRKEFLFLITIVLFTSCGLVSQDNDPLDPSKPITITVWHYYNGNIQNQFDLLVERFNETVGVERGIVVDSQSYGDVGQLANAVYDSANKTIGSLPLPDLFLSYPDNAYRVNLISELLDINTLFTEQELAGYREEFLDEGRIGTGPGLKIFPIAKSSEILYLNKTFWDEFVNVSGADINRLRTWEGVLEIAQEYYNLTGKAFLGIDASANFMFVSAIQLGSEIYSDKDDSVSLNFTKEIGRKIWDFYYIPYMKGFFEKNGRFSSDDARTDSVLAYTGSTAGAVYFPTEVTFPEGDVYPIDPMILPYPYFEEGRAFAYQQGAGMCITKSDEPHEYGAGLFLKWFTEPEQNVEFSVLTGYMPVMNESLKKEMMYEALSSMDMIGAAIPGVIDSTVYMLDNYTMYSTKPFEGSFELRSLLENHLFSKITVDLGLVEEQVNSGEDRSKLVEALISELEFEKWYDQIHEELLSLVN